MVELADHPWYLGCQFHPEYKSKPTEPHPLFVSYIAAARAEQERRPQRERVLVDGPLIEPGTGAATGGDPS
jgi:hypothetical protein